MTSPTVLRVFIFGLLGRTCNEVMAKRFSPPVIMDVLASLPYMGHRVRGVALAHIKLFGATLGDQEYWARGPANVDAADLDAIDIGKRERH